MRTQVLLAAIAVPLFLATPVAAGTITFGPYPDFAGWEEVTSSVTIPTEFTATIHIPFDGNITLHIHDWEIVRVTRRVPVYVPTYVRIKIFGDPIIEDPLSFFDIYAKDLDPDHPGTSLTGFNAADPELIPLSYERFVGASGTEYPAPVQALYVGDLPFVVPDFDLSAFAQADPGSIVYLAGPGNIPLADAPEPATLSLLAVGALALVRRRRA